MNSFNTDLETMVGILAKNMVSWDDGW